MNNTREDIKNKMHKEPTFSLFESNGFTCLIVRYVYGSYNGYVMIDKNHPLYGKKYSDDIYFPKEIKEISGVMNLFLYAMEEDKKENYYPLSIVFTAHGGITYSEKGIMYLKDHTLFKDLWFFGFDCAHAGDYQPYTDFNMVDDVYRDFEYVKSNVISLASQLEDYANLFQLHKSNQ